MTLANLLPVAEVGVDSTALLITGRINALILLRQCLLICRGQMRSDIII